MPQSLAYNYLHFITGTKYRVKTILQGVKGKRCGYISGICTKLESHGLEIGGAEDHIHILFFISKKITLIEWAEEGKKSSSKWMKTQGDAFQNFYWEGGYAAFSVSPRQVEKVRNYIANQEEHHRMKTFEKVYIAFFKKV